MARNQSKKNAIARLMRDLKEWHDTKDEFPCINACPLESNIFEWHCNVCPDSGDFKDVIFHLIIIFDETYPVRAPDVKLCTSIPHPNVFGDWICLDMLKRYEIGEKYQGWTAAYSVTSILMQLQSFLFEQKKVDQMGYSNYSVKRRFDESEFKSYYLPRIKAFKCEAKECEHRFDKPYPSTLSIDRMYSKQKNDNSKTNTNTNTNTNNNNDNNNNKDNKSSKNNGNKSKRNRKKKNSKKLNKENSKIENSNGNSNGNSNESDEKNRQVEKRINESFCFWDGIYKDLENTIFGFFSINDLLKAKKVCKKFEMIVKNSKIIQTDSIRCWFHRSKSLNNGSRMLCLGYGIRPIYFDNENQVKPTLAGQIFCARNREKLAEPIRKEIGNLPMIEKIELTFDLLSSDAFDTYKIRKSAFAELEFTHFLPLYINNKHGKMAMDEMSRYAYKIFARNAIGSQLSPKSEGWLKILAVSNAMKSLIVSVMDDSESNNGEISLHYSINILEAFFKLHHTLLGIYFHHKSIGKLLQHQIELFFQCDKNGDYFYRNKKNIPDFGVFFAYLTLWENKEGYLWEDIAIEMLEETFTRQVKWVCNENHDLVLAQGCTPAQRQFMHWHVNRVSNRLFMFYYFFYSECCQIGDKTPFEKFKEYNENYGNLSDDTMAIKLQAFVKKLATSNIDGFKEFFQVINVPYPGAVKLGKWFLKCLKTSEMRGYHKKHLFKPSREAIRGEKHELTKSAELMRIIEIHNAANPRFVKESKETLPRLKQKCNRLMRTVPNEHADITRELINFCAILDDYCSGAYTTECMKYLDGANTIWKIGEWLLNRQFKVGFDNDWAIADAYNMVLNKLLDLSIDKIRLQAKKKNIDSINFALFTLSKILDRNLLFYQCFSNMEDKNKPFYSNYFEDIYSKFLKYDGFDLLVMSLENNKFSPNENIHVRWVSHILSLMKEHNVCPSLVHLLKDCKKRSVRRLIRDSGATTTVTTPSTIATKTATATTATPDSVPVETESVGNQVNEQWYQVGMESQVTTQAPREVAREVESQEQRMINKQVKSAPHGMHSGQRPRRPPIAMNWM